MDRWFEANDVRPITVAEVEDSAVIKVFGQEGAGLLPSRPWSRSKCVDSTAWSLSGG